MGLTSKVRSSLKLVVHNFKNMRPLLSFTFKKKEVTFPEDMHVPLSSVSWGNFPTGGPGRAVGTPWYQLSLSFHRGGPAGFQKLCCGSECLKHSVYFMCL